jgi:glutamate racemase
VFDSGIGGLTVLAAIRARLPNESLIYLGDTARVPYGTKSGDVVRRYASRCARFLVDGGAKMVVVACNTASAHALTSLRQELSVPVVGVIDPGAAVAARSTRSGRIGVIGTEGTISSQSYQRALAAAAPAAEVLALPCPLFVPLAEEGMVDHPATRLIAQEYLAPLAAAGIDTLVLGCTHYPLLAPLIRSLLGPTVGVIDSGTAVAEAVAEVLAEHQLAAAARRAPDRFFATDVSDRVRRVGSAFLGQSLVEVELVDL